MLPTIFGVTDTEDGKPEVAAFSTIQMRVSELKAGNVKKNRKSILYI